MKSVRQRKQATAEPEESPRHHASPTEDFDWVQQLVLASVGVLGFVVILGLLYIELCLPCPIEPEAHTFDPIPKFEGPLEPNNELKTIKKINPGAYRGPESLAFYNGKIYTGVGDGRIVEIDIATNELRTIV